MNKHLMLTVLLCASLTGCSWIEVPLSKNKVNEELLNRKGSTIDERLLELEIGMCEEAIYTVLDIPRNLKNISKLGPGTIFEFKQLLEGRVIPKNDCANGSVAGLPYTGWKLPVTSTERHGHFSEIVKWKTRNHGTELQYSFVFLHGALLGYIVEGKNDKEEFSIMYLWDGLFKDPWGRVIPQ